jgi:hypothetical protein
VHNLSCLKSVSLPKLSQLAESIMMEINGDKT